MSFEPDEIVNNAQNGRGPCQGCPAHTDTQGEYVNPGLLNPDGELMFLTMDPSHETDWGLYASWSEYNSEKSRLFKDHWPGGKAIRDLLSDIPDITIDDVWLADAVKCPVNNNLAGNIDANTAFQHCLEYLQGEIKHVDPKVIITMGNDPAEQLLSGIFNRDVGPIKSGTEHAGRIFETTPPVVISPHWAHGWLRRNNNGQKVREAILDILDKPTPPSNEEFIKNQVERLEAIKTSDSPTHEIPRDTWRGRVARVLDKNNWMDAHEVSRKVTNSSTISKTLSKGGASSVLSDMRRHDDVERRSASGGTTQYEYRLRKDAVVK